MNHGGHIVKVACDDYLLMGNDVATLLTGCELRLLQHFSGVPHHFAVGVCESKLQGIEFEESPPVENITPTAQAHC